MRRNHASAVARVVSRLNAEIIRIVGAPDMKENRANQGAEVLTMTPERFADFIRKETARWAKVIKDSGAQFEQQFI